MKLLNHSPELLRLRLYRRSALIGLWCISLTVLELCGRQWQSDTWDFIGALGLLTLGVWTDRIDPVLGHKLRLRCLAVFGGPLLKARNSLAFDFGLDFGGKPAIALGRPPIFTLCFWALLGLVVVSISLLPWLPEVFRQSIVPFAYLAYLAGAMALWTLLGVALLVHTLFTLALVRDNHLKRSLVDSRNPHFYTFLELCTYAAMAVALAWWAPGWLNIVLMSFGTVICVAASFCIQGPTESVIWKAKAKNFRNKKYRSVPIGDTYVLQISLITLFTIFLIIISRGQLLAGNGWLSIHMPITSALGLALNGLGMISILLLTRHMLFAHWLRYRFQKHRCALPILHIEAQLNPEQKQKLKMEWLRQGWKLRFAPAPKQPTDVAIQIIETSIGRDNEQDLDPFATRKWPRILTLEQLAEPDCQEQFKRRYHRQLRRLLYRRYKSIYESARARDYENGNGFWIGAQHWFINGLSRDERENDSLLQADGTILDDSIGPHYHQVFNWRVRGHLLQVLQSVGIDLIFVEDGLSFRKLRPVLDQIFEFYDIHEDGHTIEDRHFKGQNGIRAIFHKFELGNPLKDETYPEPDYQDIGRGRILHIFRDRGEQEELIDIPGFDSNIPIPILMG